ncbi:MAG: 3'-5' exonuclease [Senegalia sp. (in: firmicutes)]|uniref:3'-5' exonuclease n=1 Tax=Senegalia sp. (in: firmicutes) TaxID=1924098 RepID=UPI003F98477A
MILNTEQKKIIESDIKGHSLVKGVAGSGKTTVALYSAIHALNHYCRKNDKILIITYAKTLVEYLSVLYNKAMEENLIIPLFDNFEKKVEIKTIDSIILGLYFKIYKTRPIIISAYERRDYILRAIEYTKSRFSRVDILNKKYLNFIMEEIVWIKSCGIKELEEYLYIERIGRGSTESEGPMRLRKGSDTRSAIYSIMNQYDKYLKMNKRIDFKTLALEVLKGLEKGYKSDKYFKVIVDESQDLTKVQLEIIKKLYDEENKNSNLMMLADSSQSIYSHSWLSSNPFKSIGLDIVGKSKILSKNYRTTKQIALAAYSLIKKDESKLSNDISVKGNAIDVNGEIPIIKGFINIQKEAEYIANEINNNLKKDYKLNEIAIISRRSDILKEIRNKLFKLGVNANVLDKMKPNFDQESVKLITMHSIKGLEFKVIFLVGANEKVIPYFQSEDDKNNNDILALERRLFYVGMTRAKKKLYITYWGNPSRFIKDIDNSLVAYDSKKYFKKFYRVGFENYLFQNKLIDKMSSEEVVRQWALYEINKKLFYPIKNIDIEYEIQTFSIKGFADIVVYNDNNIPLIIGECKSHKESIKNYENQIKKYLEFTQGARYGFITNGIDTKLFRKKNNEILECSSLPKHIEIKKDDKILILRNLKNNKQYYINDNINNDELTVRNKFDENISPSCLSKLEVLGKVSAGNFKVVYEESLRDIVIPDEILEGSEDYFILEVDGDSMIKAGINKGDYVIVKKQNYAKNMDIVVAVLEDQATMKRFIDIGNQVILAPENDNYTPMQVNKEEIIINGVVTGHIANKIE